MVPNLNLSCTGCRRSVFGSALALIFLLACGREEPAPWQRSQRQLSEGWRFLAADADAAGIDLDDGSPGWSPVRVPHTYNALDGQDGGDDYLRGRTWYRLRLPLGEKRSDRRYWLRFDAANTVADVYVNASHVGQHAGGFAAFGFDVSDALQRGDNVLAVRVDNSPTLEVPPLRADFTFFGGLYRDVWLMEVPNLHLGSSDPAASGLQLDVSDISAQSASFSARVAVTQAGSELESGVSVRLTVLDAERSSVAVVDGAVDAVPGQTVSLTLAGAVPRPRLWQGRRDPYLYTAAAELLKEGNVIDRVEQTFGIRSFAFDPDGGFSLNGEPLELYGVNRHQDRLDMGWAVGKPQHDEDMALIEELGANAIRLAHYQHSSYFYELCDRAGLIVWAEIPLVDEVADSPEFRSNAQQQLRELIRQSHHHPSIVAWGIGNEQRTDDEATNSLLAELSSLARAEDPSRPTTYAHCCGSATGALASHTELVGFNVYYGWYMGAAGNLGPYLDAVHAARPDTPIAVSEYGAGGSLSQHQEPPQPPAPGGPFHPEEYQTQLHEETWQQLAARPYLWGKFIWNMFDFAVDSRNEGDTPGRNDKGLVSYDRQVRKDAFFFYKANWTTSPTFVHITSRRHQPRTTEAADIKVYANHGGAVQLTLNGAPPAMPAIIDGVIHRWPGVPLAAGDNVVEARAVDTGGATLASDRVVWTRQ